MGKTKRKVKKSIPMAPWALFLLKVTHHLSLCVAILSMVAAIMASSVYVEDYGYRYLLETSTDIESNKHSFATQNLYDKSSQLLRYVTIRSQLEVDGKFDRNKIINISDYCYRKANDYANTKMMYFPDANFLLGDLLMWQQSTPMSYLQEEIENVSNVRYSFTNADGVELHHLVSSEDEYKELLRQLIECIRDIAYNYNDYLHLGREFNRSDTNFVYYVDMGNATGDVYSNISSAWIQQNKQRITTETEQSIVESYFENIDYFTKGSFGMYDTYSDDTNVFIEEIANLSATYSYAFGDTAVIYMGYDLSLGVDNDIKTVWEAYDDLNLKQIYILVAIMAAALLYYFIVLCYLMYASGRKVDETGEEYIELAWIDMMPLELYLMWLGGLSAIVVVASVIGAEGLSRYPYPYFAKWIMYVIFLATVFINVLVLETLLSIAKRIKSRTFLENSFLYKFGVSQAKRLFTFFAGQYKKFVKKTQYYAEHSGHFEKTWGVLLIEIVFTMMSIVIICNLLARRDTEGAVIASILYALVVFIASFKRMIRKEERMDIVEKIEGIVAGEECRVEEEKLSTENAALGHAVNEIGEGIQNAVQISTRDERLKAELLTNVSHDIKTPLTSIITYVDLLKNEQLDNKKAKEYIEVLENKSHKLKNLIQDLIEVSKISTGNIEYEMMPLNVHELMLQATGEYEERFYERCLKLVYNNDVTEAVIMADSRRMWRVMENLFSNIYKYALEETRIYIEVSQEEETLSISMKNISAKELNVKAEDLTERFVRGDLSRATEGSGLGLAIAQNLVVGQNGQFVISSDGDLFKVKLSFKLHTT